MQKRNEHIRRLKILLDIIIKNKDIHIKWLNTLSFLEHIGARKIHKINLGKFLTEQILSHAFEEARHAYYFKKYIKKIENNVDPALNYDYKNLLSGFSSYIYFQKLDLEIYKNIKKQYSNNNSIIPFLCYLYVTYIIEERADMVFLLYQEVLQTNQIPISIKGIIREEEKHLKEIYILLEQYDKSFMENLKIFSNLESNLFDWYLNRLEKVVFRSSEDLKGVPQEDLL